MIALPYAIDVNLNRFGVNVNKRLRKIGRKCIYFNELIVFWHIVLCGYFNMRSYVGFYGIWGLATRAASSDCLTDSRQAGYICFRVRLLNRGFLMVRAVSSVG